MNRLFTPYRVFETQETGPYKARSEPKALRYDFFQFQSSNLATSAFPSRNFKEKPW